MQPIVWDLRPYGLLPIGGYGLSIAIGMVIAALGAARAGARTRQDVGSVLACCGYTVAGGLLGAHLTYLFVETARLGSFERALAAPFGLVFYGAVPGGVLAAWISARMLGVRFVSVLDLTIPSIAAGHAVGRIGCFLGGCCFGIEHHGFPSVTFTDPMAPAADPSVPRHPTQLYEALGLAVIGLVFALVPVKQTDGRRALAYVVAYAALRFVVEMFRGDMIRGSWMGLSTSQLLSIAAAAIAIGALLWLRAAVSTRASAA